MDMQARARNPVWDFDESLQNLLDEILHLTLPIHNTDVKSFLGVFFSFLFLVPFMVTSLNFQFHNGIENFQLEDIFVFCKVCSDRIETL